MLSKGSMITRPRQRLSQHPRVVLGLSASTIVLAEESKIAAHSVKVPVSDEYYAIVDSETNAIIVPLHPDICGEIAECKVLPSATVEGRIVQVLKYGQERRLVVALPQSAIGIH